MVVVMSGTPTNRVVPLLLVLLLGGCNSSVQGWEVNSIVKNCATHGGVHSINTVVVTRGICSDGAVVDSERAK